LAAKDCCLRPAAVRRKHYQNPPNGFIIVGPDGTEIDRLFNEAANAIFESLSVIR
jgi:hypothetical protein